MFNRLNLIVLFFTNIWIAPHFSQSFLPPSWSSSYGYNDYPANCHVFFTNCRGLSWIFCLEKAFFVSHIPNIRRGFLLFTAFESLNKNMHTKANDSYPKAMPDLIKYLFFCFCLIGLRGKDDSWEAGNDTCLHLPWFWWQSSWQQIIWWCWRQNCCLSATWVKKKNPSSGKKCIRLDFQGSV